MNTMNETSATKTADPVCVSMGSTLDTPSGSAAFSGLENGVNPLGAESIPKADLYPSAAEESAVPPVASDEMVICSWCGFMVRFGRGEVVHVPQCRICACEVANA